MTLPFAEDVNYWKTSRTPADAWITKAIEVIKKLGGSKISEGFGARDGSGAFLIYFELGEEQFRIAWPVLPTRKPEDAAAARVQAATLLFHDVKSKALAASILGPRTAFVGHLLLPNGVSVGEASSTELRSTVKLLELRK